jgi:hypothetical protein
LDYSQEASVARQEGKEGMKDRRSLEERLAPRAEAIKRFLAERAAGRVSEKYSKIAEEKAFGLVHDKNHFSKMKQHSPELASSLQELALIHEKRQKISLFRALRAALNFSLGEKDTQAKNPYDDYRQSVQTYLERREVGKVTSGKQDKIEAGFYRIAQSSEEMTKIRAANPALAKNIEGLAASYCERHGLHASRSQNVDYAQELKLAWGFEVDRDIER